MGSRVAVERSKMQVGVAAVVASASPKKAQGKLAQVKSARASGTKSPLTANSLSPGKAGGKKGTTALSMGAAAEREKSKVIELRLKSTGGGSSPVTSRGAAARGKARQLESESKDLVLTPSVEAAPKRGLVTKIEKVAQGSRTSGEPLACDRGLSDYEREDLVLKYRLKARKLSRSILRRWHSRLDLQEVDSIVDLSLCEAVRRYDPSKGASFMTFLYFHLRGNLIRAVAGAVQAQAIPNFEEEAVLWADESDEGRGDHGPSLGEITDAFYNEERVRPDEILLKRELSRMSAEAFASLDPLEREVVERIFFREQQLLDIAKTLGYSRCHISRVKKRALQVLYRVLKQSLGEEAPHGPGPLFDSDDEAKEVSLKGIRRRRPRSGSSHKVDAVTARRAA